MSDQSAKYSTIKSAHVPSNFCTFSPALFSPQYTTVLCSIQQSYSAAFNSTDFSTISPTLFATNFATVITAVLSTNSSTDDPAFRAAIAATNRSAYRTTLPTTYQATYIHPFNPTKRTAKY